MGPGSRVIFFSSSLLAASTITPPYLLYAATKGAIEQMTRVLAKDLGKQQINVNVVSPGPTQNGHVYSREKRRIDQDDCKWKSIWKTWAAR
jgi:3-oxoacyl-[acyl-carrier protein] reductase